MRAKLASLKAVLFRHRSVPLPAQGAWLKQVVQGWYNYYAVPYTIKALGQFRYWLSRIWWRALRRGSQHAERPLWWHRMRRIVDRWLPKPKILHPWPNARFAVNHPR